jgi:4,5-DOPA dioxygenase extradiol
MTINDAQELFTSKNKTQEYPVLFVGHGSPMNGLEDNVFSRGWKNLGEALPRPRAILMVSAHWLTRGTGVDVSQRPKTIYDFYGFPDALYALTYPAPGAPHLAEMTRTLMTPRDVGTEEYGLDHGAWIVLRWMYPNADIPVYQLSVDFDAPATAHYEMGQKLSSLRERGVLIMGSGNIVHNLRSIDWKPNAKVFDQAGEFDEKVKSLIIEGKHEELCAYEDLGPSAKFSVPTPDHYYPLLYVLGAGGKDARVSFPIEGIVHGSISMRSVLLD